MRGAWWLYLEEFKRAKHNYREHRMYSQHSNVPGCRKCKNTSWRLAKVFLAGQI